ncbi:endopeptidase La [Flavobacteriales bacterium]|nr:endopeptidase La [Flavobacteriales bacterium]
MDNIFEQDIMLQTVMEDEMEFIPLLSTEEDDEKVVIDDNITELPILPIRNTVLFPGVVIPITVGRDKSIELINKAYKGDKTIGVVSQKDPEIEDPEFEDLHKIGTVAYILKVLKMPDGSTTAIIQGKKRVEIKECLQTDPFIKCSVNIIPKPKVKATDEEFIALVDSLKDMSLQIIKSSPSIPSDASFAIKNIESPTFIINFIASNMNLSLVDKQRMLEIASIKKRGTEVLTLLTKELQKTELKNKIQSKVKVDLDQQQREYFLNQQLKTIQEELGGGAHDKEIEEFRKRASKKKWDVAVAERFEKELEKLQRINPQAADYNVHVNYLEFMLDLPWNEFSKDKVDLNKAEKILDKHHYGLKDVKDRILEHLAVLKLKGDMKSPIICLYGPPGVGKTSLGKSVAKAIDREYVRMSLGGLRDESEIRGHRKTYIGAMAGRILQSLKKAKTSNPVFVLDELDKVGHDHMGDPSSALLEVLDPEQNGSFYDNYLEMDYDLSNVLFIATANNLSTIQPALRDRLEIIEVNGYTSEEKVEIAKRHLLPKQLKEHGLKKTDVKMDKAVLTKVVESYTRESGVRGLEKKIAKLVRNHAKDIAMEKEIESKLDTESVEKILGPGMSKEAYEGNDFAGVVTGLAWTQVGGDILYIEASLSKGKGKLTLTGNLGDVMKESAVLALEYLKANSEKFGIEHRLFEEYNLHVHVPEGATPKDGPSAGITMLTAITSAFTQKKVRSRIAMTGEITLRGKVLPVGGIKEKILAAKRAKIKDIILCRQNEKDIIDINAEYLKGLSFHYVDQMSEVLDYAILSQKVKRAKVL